MSEELIQRQAERIKALEDALRRALPIIRLALYRKLASHIEELLGGGS